MKHTYIPVLALAVMLTAATGSGGVDPNCNWDDGYMPAELYWSAWKSIPNQTRDVRHVVTSSVGFYRQRKFCLYRSTNGAELDSLMAQVRRNPTQYVGSDNTVVLLVKRLKNTDTVSFVGTRYVTINGKGYLMSKELFVFVAKQMPFAEATRMLEDTTEYETPAINPE